MNKYQFLINFMKFPFLTHLLLNMDHHEVKSLKQN